MVQFQFHGCCHVGVRDISNAAIGRLLQSPKDSSAARTEERSIGMTTLRIIENQTETLPKLYLFDS